MLLRRDAEDLGDDGDGQLLAVARDEVDVMPGARVGLEVVEQLGGDLLGAFAQAEGSLLAKVRNLALSAG